jgi:hypothetical protein
MSGANPPETNARTDRPTLVSQSPAFLKAGRLRRPTLGEYPGDLGRHWETSAT